MWPSGSSGARYSKTGRRSVPCGTLSLLRFPHIRCWSKIFIFTSRNFKRDKKPCFAHKKRNFQSRPLVHSGKHPLIRRRCSYKIWENPDVPTHNEHLLLADNPGVGLTVQVEKLAFENQHPINNSLKKQPRPRRTVAEEPLQSNFQRELLSTLFQ